MKKGLLSLLAVALTVVGCQNYDDQFDELSDQITALSGTVQGLSSVADQITALSSTVNGLATAASVSGLQGDITTIKAAVDALTSSLADVATAADLGIISSTLANVQADVKELLAANAVINQSITINNVATLEYVESLISTDADDPNVIVNGSITVNYNPTNFTDAGHLARINKVCDKFATALNEVVITNTDSTTTLSFANLAFVDSYLFIDGNTILADGDSGNDLLRTVTGNVSLTNIIGDINLGLLTSADHIEVPGGADITALKMGSVKATSLSTTGAVQGHLNLVSATIVEGGTSAVASIVAPEATSVAITSAATLTVNCAKAATIDIEGTALTGNMSITATSTTIVNAKKVKTVDGTITTGQLAQLWLDALTGVATFTSQAVIINMPELATQTGAITLSKILDFSAPKLDTSNVVSIVAATDISIKDHSAKSNIYALAAKNMTITALAATNSVSFDKAATVFPSLVKLTVDGVDVGSGPYITEQTNTVSVTSDVLTDLIVNTASTDMINAVRLHGASKLTTLNTGGFIRDFELIGATTLTSADIGHDHIEGSDAASFRISGATLLTTVAPTALDEVGHITLTGLPAMTSLNLASMVELPILGAYNITISNTGLSGSYAIASDVTTTTGAFADKIFSNDLMTLKPYMDLAAASAVVTYTFLGDIITSISTRTYDSLGAATAVTANGTRTLQSAIETFGGLNPTGSSYQSLVATPVTELAFPRVFAE